MKPMKLVQSNTILHEQLALRRLKELMVKPTDRPPKRSQLLRLEWLWLLLAALFRRAELVRQTAPDRRPIGRHEWESPYNQRTRLL